jgi:hypothetical protein
MEKKGLKSDEGKQGWFALPLVVLQPLLDVFNAGVGHYGLHNCLNPFDNASERFYDAQMRHVAECQLEPMAIDPQDGCYHEAKVAFNALMRLYHCKNQQKAPIPMTTSSVESIPDLATLCNRRGGVGGVNT